MACCELVAENTEDTTIDTKEKVKFKVKVELHFIDPGMIAVRPDGQVAFQYRSLSYQNLGHMEACRFFDRGFQLLADMIGTDVETITENAQSKMLRRI